MKNLLILKGNIMHIESLLSDKFAEYSGTITALHEKKKELIADMKKLYEAHKAAVKEIDDQAIAVHKSFIEWQTDHDSPKTTKQES